ncbi:MAG: hypothetical protein ABFQ95_02950 [Pseudomonadota bacterium]
MQHVESDINEVIADLDKTFRMALEEKNFTAAVRAKEIIGKLIGAFSVSANASRDCDLQNITDEGLETLVKNIQEKLQK